MTQGCGELPSNVLRACADLRDGLEYLLGPELVGLWAYGATLCADRPLCLGDIDTYGVLTKRPSDEIAADIEQLHAALAENSEIEWDSWYILDADARSSNSPTHALRVGVVDHAWALHRAHWLAGQYVGLFGQSPPEIVTSPTWPELRGALAGEVQFMERIVAEHRDDPGHSAFLTLNACRVIYSLEAHNVVVSKRAASVWALEHLPSEWHPAIRAAGRVYDGVQHESDEVVLRERRAEIVYAARVRLTREED